MIKVLLNGIEIEGSAEDIAEVIKQLQLDDDSAPRAYAVGVAQAPREIYVPSESEYVLLADGEIVYVTEVDHLKQTADVAIVGGGYDKYKTVGFRDIQRLATEEEENEQWSYNRRNDRY